MRILDHGSIDEDRRQEAARSIEARLELIRDVCDELLDGDSNVDIGEIEGVIFGIADSDLAEAQATQRPRSTPPAPLMRILGELLDGLSQTAGREKGQLAAYAIRMMDESKESDDYDQSVSGSRRQ